MTLSSTATGATTDRPGVWFDAVDPSRTRPSVEAWSLLQSIFHQAAKVETADRSAFVDRACAGDPALRAAVLSLLANDTSMDWLRGGLDRAIDDSPSGRDWSGRTLGPYRLRRKLGEGGMGSVYLAERCDGEFEQRVAVKVMHGGLANESLRRRFLVERQILARLEHPHIARFLGGGTTSAGVPYLVMERIDGEPITDYCDRHQLAVDERLALFRQVLDAVAYAHRNLVVHRDLKPSNILVVGAGAAGPPTVKLLDFGIAKLLDDEWDAGLTRIGQRPMTPAYASPEQRLGLPVTTASDIFSLGTVLYELLSGRRALPKARGPLIVEPPPPPSEVAEPTMARELLGELDHIVTHAMTLDPAERYPSAADFDADLRRFARDEPLAVVPHTLPYLTRKLWARQRAGLVAVILLVAAISWGTWAQHREARAARAAESETAMVVDYLVRLFEMARPSRSQELPATLAEVVENAAIETTERLDASPQLKARLQHTLGRISWTLGEFERAVDLQRQAVDIRAATLGPTDPSVAEALFELGRAYMGLGRHGDAETALTHALAIRERGGPSNALAESLSELSVLYRLTSRYAEAADAAGRAVAIRSTIEGSSEADLATSLDHQALALDELDRLEDAIPLVRQALEIRQRTLGPHHADVAQSLNSLAILHLRSGQFEAAEERLRQSLAIRQRILPAGHANLGQSHYNLAQTYYTLERDDDARRHLQQALIIWRGAESPNLQRLGFASALLGDLERAQGRHPAAQAAYGEAIDLLTTALGPDHGHLITVYEGLAHAHCDQGQLGPARRHFDRSLAIARSLFAEESTNVRELVASEQRCFDGSRTAGADGASEDS